MRYFGTFGCFGFDLIVFPKLMPSTYKCSNVSEVFKGLGAATRRSRYIPDRTIIGARRSDLYGDLLAFCALLQCASAGSGG